MKKAYAIAMPIWILWIFPPIIFYLAVILFLINLIVRKAREEFTIGKTVGSTLIHLLSALIATGALYGFYYLWPGAFSRSAFEGILDNPWTSFGSILFLGAGVFLSWLIDALLHKGLLKEHPKLYALTGLPIWFLIPTSTAFALFERIF